jgi:hypothetical protein
MLSFIKNTLIERDLLSRLTIHKIIIVSSSKQDPKLRNA